MVQVVNSSEPWVELCDDIEAAYEARGERIGAMASLGPPKSIADDSSKVLISRDRGMPVGNGVYLYELRAGGFRSVRKMALIR